MELGIGYKLLNLLGDWQSKQR